jgi:hypothetical protein
MGSVPRSSCGGVPWEIADTDANPFAVGVEIVDVAAGNVGMIGFDSRVNYCHLEAIRITARRRRRRRSSRNRNHVIMPSSSTNLQKEKKYFGLIFDSLGEVSVNEGGTNLLDVGVAPKRLEGYSWD